MRVAIFASKGVSLANLNELLPEDVTELIVDGSKGVGEGARTCAQMRGIPLREFPLERGLYGREARMVQRARMIDEAEFVIAFWDGASRDIPRILKRCSRPGVPFCILRADNAKEPRS